MRYGCSVCTILYAIAGAIPGALPVTSNDMKSASIFDSFNFLASQGPSSFEDQFNYTRLAYVPNTAFAYCHALNGMMNLNLKAIPMSLGFPTATAVFYISPRKDSPAAKAIWHNPHCAVQVQAGLSRPSGSPSVADLACLSKRHSVVLSQGWMVGTNTSQFIHLART